ncbi:uncharacterized protein LY89DRAFT_715632 [Mollisia scopiformis]|uniref:Cytochrome b561 domain-containing protein n=1 Tax=Mollisia scopiformis TaxID=149040 RepID=A0A194XMT0_MOLSC|nr:uncharacterized protein LY89DRAFT_715632 [Mollisia scopiformis]KUJ21463.1 hypothetical protein LY89DRAFT_715632 [Mollisia scopiformis]
MAPQDDLSPAGSSTYSSNTMYVGDGTWDATRNDFLLPNLQGLNFETMRYNGMGNRFAGLPQYHQLIKGHGVIAVITFLVIVPAAILIAAFYGRSPFWALRMHIYLQILTVALTTVVFTLGWFAVGPERSLTNPHHGIGLAIYVLVLWQAITGWWIHRRERGRGRRRLPVKLVLHQWLGRATALLGFAQVPLGLTLYGSPKWTFILYALWMFFLLVWFFILSYRAQIPIDTGLGRASSHGGTVIEDRKPSRFGGLLGPLAAGAGAAALLSGRRRDRSRSRSRVEVIPSRRGSRRGSGSYVEEEKYDSRRRDDRGGGVMDKVLKGAAVLGVAGLAKSWYDGRKRRRDEDAYSSVAPDTPSRRNDRRDDRRDDRRRYSDDTESVEVHRMEEGRTNRPILPGPGDPVMAAAAISAAEARPVTPRPVRQGARRDSYDSDSYYDYDSTISPSRRPQSSHGVRNGLLGALGGAWIGKKLSDRRNKKEADRLARLEQDRIEEERRARRGQTPQRLTGDGFPAGRHGRRGSRTQSSDLSSVIDNPHDIRPGAIPPVPPSFAAPVAAGAAAGAAISQSQSRHDITQHVMEPVSMPPIPPDPQGILHQESGSESYMSAGGHPHRRHSERRRREGEAAMAAAAGAAATLAAEEERRRQRSQSRHEGSNVASPPVSVKVKVHDDKDRHVTLRRLTEQEAAAEREARRSERHRRRADSLSSLSGTDTAASRRRYRRDERDAERRAESSVPPPPPPPVMAPLSPPNPAFAAGRRPKDSAYYSGRPGEPSASGGVGAPSVESPESHATWSAMSPDVSQGDGAEAAAERRRRRRLERNARNHPGGTTGTVDFT